MAEAIRLTAKISLQKARLMVTESTIEAPKRNLTTIGGYYHASLSYQVNHAAFS
jgi:hypothetical protein